MVHSLVLHGLIAILSLFLFIVFAWWWDKAGDATKIYKINCFLMFGLFLVHTGAAVKYYLVLSCGKDVFDIFTWYMSWQQYLIIFPLICYVVDVVGKLRRGGK